MLLALTNHNIPATFPSHSLHSHSQSITAIHIRTQFTAFEHSVGSDDGSAWQAAQKEVNDWLACSHHDCGLGLFKILETRILEEIPKIRIISIQNRRKQRKLFVELQKGLDDAVSESYYKHSFLHSHVSSAGALNNTRRALFENIRLGHRSSNGSMKRKLNTNTNTNTNNTTDAQLTEEELAEEKRIYDTDTATGTPIDNRIYVYIASDNNVVKEAMVKVRTNTLQHHSITSSQRCR